MTIKHWRTNDPEIAKRLNAIDRAHQKARDKANGWSLKEKVEYYRKVDSSRQEAYGRVLNSVEAKK